MEWLFYIVSILYTLVLVVTVGLTLFETYFSRGVSDELLKQQRIHRNFLTKCLFILVICSIFEQSIIWLDQFGAERFNFFQLFFETLTGQVWTAILVLVIIGLFIQKLSTIYLSIWTMLLLLVESVDGHISTLTSYAIVFDFIHLLCAAIWVGGLAVFILNWRAFKHELLGLMQSFMKIIWISIIFISLSGMMLTIMILPDVSYLLYTAWGKWLIIKVLIVLAALYCGYIVRNYVRKNELPIVKALIIELASVIVVLAIAGIITMISPEPAMNSLDHHKMGEELHYTVELIPNRPGPNELDITLWTLEADGDIQSVEVVLVDIEKGERTKRTLILTEAELKEPYDFNGFVESRYHYEEPLRLPYPSKWKQDVTITFESGQERQFSLTFEN